MSGQNRNIGVFPSQEVSNEEKDSREYGLLVGRAIEQEWFKKDSGGVVRFQQNREEFHRLRKYARGEQSTKKYRDELSINGDLSYLNLDWKPVPILPKFVDILVNGMNSRLFDVSVNAIDELASKAKGKKRRELEDKMLTKRYMMKIEEQIGIDNSKSHAETPDNPEELDLHMQLNFKQGVEIAQEEALKYVFMKNDVDAILRKRLLLDMVVCGIAVAKHKYNEHSGITLEYVDPADMVFNYTDDPYFRDLYYWGEVKRVPIVELKKEHPWLTEEDLQMIVRTASDDRDYSSGRYSQQEENTDGLTVNVLYYNYKTYRKDVYKEKSTRSGGKKTTKRDSTFNPPKDKRTDFDRLEVVREVIYEGTKILGVEENLSNGGPVLSWGLMSNMVRPKGDGTKVLPNYCLHAPNVYKGRLEGIISRVTPYADMIQLQHLKLQQTVQRMTPDGVAIDVDSLAEIDLGNGTAYNPQEALRMYFQTGSVVMRTQAVDGTRNMNPNPIQPIQGHGSGDKISILVGTYNHYINIIRDVTGLNEAADGSSPSEYALPGVQKLAAANSNTATRHIQDGVNYIIKRLAVGAAGRIQDVIQHHPQKQSFIRAIGAN
ncbi:MAG: hypothetical protein K0U41_01825, partial [Gammaproteobacteria bacterium]|nr:hypothetical protein [Gammaproteobacteria bacterium]